MLIDYPHSKITHSLKVVKLNKKLNKKSIEQNRKISRVL
jgi:hypothetical protein